MTLSNVDLPQFRYVATASEITQYRGTVNEAEGDGQQAQFVWNGPRDHVVRVFSWGLRRDRGADSLSGEWGQMSSLARNVTKHLYNGIHTYTDYYFGLVLTNGGEFKLAGRLNPSDANKSADASIWIRPGAAAPITIEQLGRILEARMASVQLPVAIARFRAGESTSFGKLKVGPQGILTDYGSVAWDEIEDVQTRNGVVSVKNEGKWLPWKSVPVGQVLNYVVFDALVHTILAERSDSGRE